MKRKTLSRVATALAVGALGTSALAATMMGNNSNKGSLLIAPRIDVRTVPAGGGLPGGPVDTLITLVNDASTPVLVKCYYRSSDTVPTPLPSSFNTAFLKHSTDFTIPLTPNQPITWSALTGEVVNQAGVGPRFVAPPFQTFADGATRFTGELKCWAIGSDGVQINHNHLFMVVSIVGAPFGVGGQAWQYNAWTFQALVGTGQSALEGPVAPAPVLDPVTGQTVSSLLLDGVAYDLCPNMLLGAFQPPGAPLAVYFGTATPIPGTGNPQLNISLASCRQDLTQTQAPFITKYTYTFWNQDENARTGTHECADSWYETTFPATANQPPAAAPFTAAFPLAQFSALGTETAYVRIESIADTTVCARAIHIGFVGTIAQANAGLFTRGTNLIGRGTNPGLITYNPGPADSFKK